MSIGSPVTQNPGSVSRVSNFFAVGPSILVPCTTTSAAVAFPVLTDAFQYCTDVEITNLGTVPVWLAFGPTSSVSAVIPTAGAPAVGRCLIPGGVVTWCKGVGSLYVAGITATGTANVYIDQGYGS